MEYYSGVGKELSQAKGKCESKGFTKGKWESKGLTKGKWERKLYVQRNGSEKQG